VDPVIPAVRREPFASGSMIHMPLAQSGGKFSIANIRRSMADQTCLNGATNRMFEGMPMSAEHSDTDDVIIKPISITPEEYARSYEFAPLNEPLGAIVMVFAQLEAKLTMTIDALLGINYPAGAALEDLMQSVTTRIKLFHTLAVLKTNGIFIDKLEGNSGLRARLAKCNDYRNDYIHGLWIGISGDSFTKVRYKADRGLHPVKSTYGVTVSDLSAQNASVRGDTGSPI
jgi:hypothetical protein